MPTNEIRVWADEAMYEADPMPEAARSGPVVRLLNMTPDPLGSIAAMAMMYEGRVARSLSEIGPADRKHYFDQIKETHLKAPFEAVQFHFMIEGVTRSFTHQMVRQRTAVFAQESLRFAVKDAIDEEVALPPFIRSLPSDAPQRLLWKQAVNKIDDTYHALVESGVPAEDARGLLPHNITTRLHYVTNLRALQDHAGMRLCTQAQFEWRQVFIGMVEAIAAYDQSASTGWEAQEIAGLFRPVCYLTGKCEFNASFDRKCSIKARVQANHEVGRPSSQWGEFHDTMGEEAEGFASGFDPYRSVVRDQTDRPVYIGPITTREWLADSEAAR